MGGNVEAYYEAKAEEEALERLEPGRRARLRREWEERDAKSKARRADIRQEIHERLMELSVEVTELTTYSSRPVLSMDDIRKKMIDILTLTNEHDKA